MPGDSAVKQITIDGVTFLPVSIRFTTVSHKGSGTITFGRVGKYWLPITAIASATYAKLAAVEHLTFSHYRFPNRATRVDLRKAAPAPLIPSGGVLGL